MATAHPLTSLSLFNTIIIIAVASVAMVLFTTSTMGYALGRYSFPGKKIVIGLFVATVLGVRIIWCGATNNQH